MATIPNGILGGIRGKVGTVSGYSRYGVAVIRVAKNSGMVKPTVKRMAQREKISACTAFAKAFSGKGFFNKSFPAYGHTGSGYNRAMGAWMNLALTASNDGVSISYPLVLVSKGPLPPAAGAVAAPDGAGNIQFTWENNTGTGTAKEDDKAILVAYCPETGEAVFSFGAGTRESGIGVLEAVQFNGKPAETWMGFLSDDEKDAACSVYTGRVML